MKFLSYSLFALCLSVAAPAAAATFNVFQAGTNIQFGSFDAPVGGGALTSASFSLAGGVFDTLGAGPAAPVYDAVNNWVVGAGITFSEITNSVAFNTVDLFTNPITCGIGECRLSLIDSGGGGAPAEWYLDHLPLATPIDLGLL